MKTSSPAPATPVRPARRKWRRRLWISLAATFATLALIAGLLLTPPVQGWLLRRFIARQQGWRLEFARFGVDPTGLDANGIDFGMPGFEARTAPVAIRIAPGRLLTNGELRIERIEAQKLRVTVTPAKFVTAPDEKRVPFGGILSLLRAPFPWAVDAAAIDGEIAMRHGGDSVVVGEFRVKGGGISGEKAGTFDYEIAVNSALLPLGPENKVRSHGTVKLAQNPHGGIARIDVEGDFALPHYGSLVLPPGKFTLAIVETKAGETYEAHVALGTGGTVDFSGQLDAKHAKMAGHVAVRAERMLVSSWRRGHVPAVALNGGADFTCDLKKGDFDATLAADVDAGEWGRVRPEMAAMDDFRGHIAAAIGRHAGVLRLSAFHAELHGEKSPATLRADLLRPLGLPVPLNAPLVKLAAEHLPSTWANPWLAPAGLHLTPSEFGGEWNLGLLRGRGLAVSPAGPATVTAVTLEGKGLPRLPATEFTLNPRLELSLERATLTVPDFSASSTEGDQFDAKLTANYEFATHSLHSAGELKAFLPSLFSAGASASLMAVAGHWDIAQKGAQWRVASAGLELRQGTAAPCIAFEVLQPLSVDVEKWTVAGDEKEKDWARLVFRKFPLGWVSHWLPGRKIGGFVAEGESVLHSTKKGRLGFQAVTPWHVANAIFSVGGRELFNGEVSVKPDFAFDRTAGGTRFTIVEARDRNGNRLAGTVGFGGSVKEKRAATTISLDVDLPALPHSAETFGPLHASLRVKSHTQSPTIATVETFELRVRNDRTDLFTLEAPKPFLFGLSDSGAFTAATLAPLRLTTGEVPLAWLRPWSGPFELAGTLEPSEFALTAQFTKFLLRPIKPLHVSQFSARRRKYLLASDADLTLYPGLDLTVACEPLPKFKLAYEGAVHVTDTKLTVGGEPAFDFDGAFGFLGDDKRVLPGRVDVSTRLDFAPLARLRALAYRGCPPRGTLVARLNGDVRSEQPVEFWARLEGVPSADGTRTLPACEVAANGRISAKDNTFAGGVEARMETQPRATEAKFDATFQLDGSELTTGSTLRSSYFDAGEALALAQAFLPKRHRRHRPPTPAPAGAAVANAPVAPATAAGAEKPEYPRGSGPFWEGLRGYFDLDMRVVRFAPYQIENLRGRLDVSDRSLALSQLSGEMFAGRFGGKLRIDYDPKNPVGDHTLDGSFEVERLDSAKALQTAFPKEKSSLGALIDLHSTVHSLGNAPQELLDRAEGKFEVEGKQGVVRLHVPKQDALATAAVFGGTILLSPELRALGRLLKKLSELPIDRLRIAGQRTTDGEIDLTEFRMESPEVRLVAHGRIPAAEEEPLLKRPLELSVDLGAKDDVAVILRGMRLVKWRAGPDGYRQLKREFKLGGKVGAPDTQPLYDLLAQGVVGSKGTWGYLMRKVQAEVEKQRAGKKVSLQR